ncbi:MAG: cation:proton antiporter [Aureliella sp.]
MLTEQVLWYILIGALLISVGALRPLMTNMWLAPVHLQLLGGVLAGPWCLGLLALDLRSDAHTIEIISEIAVIISLYAAGIKMRIPLDSGAWKAPVVLATITMVATTALAALLAALLFGLSVPAAILLGAVLAPTDPVLADKIQVEHPGDHDRLRQSLTGEAGLNDGTAFPFVLLAIGLADPHLHSLGLGFSRWILVDVFWKVCGGLLFGGLAGYCLGKTILWLRGMHKEPSGPQELLTMGLIAVVYGLALTINTYAFLAVFAAAIGLRRIEMQYFQRKAMSADAVERESERREASSEVTLLREQTQVGSALERIAQVFLVVVIGVLLSTTSLFYWRYWLFAIIMLCVVRPLAVLLTMHVRSINRAQRRLIGWFGIRGIGTIYYLSFAIALGVDRALQPELGTIIGCCVVTIALSIALHGTSDSPLMKWYAARQRSDEAVATAGAS